MPVFGSASPRALARGVPRSAGEFPLVQGVYTATGVRIPAGWGGQWFGNRNNAANQLVEVALYGDSTMAGQTLTGANYSPLDRIRERLNSAGYADGGHGNLNGINDTLSAGEGLVIGQGFASGNVYVLPGESAYGDVDADNQTFTRIGRYLTIWYSCFNSAGRFTYEIDASGVEIPIDPAYPTFGGVDTFAHTAVIDLGTSGTHTIKIRNKGGRLVNAPVYTGGAFTGSGTGGTLAAGTYDYTAAFLTTGGKISPIGATRTVTIATGQTFSFILSAQLEGGVTTNIYRRVSGVGNFQLIGSVATNAGSPYLFTDSGASATTTYAQGAPPVLESTSKWVNVATVVTKATGIVLHNLAARGSGSGMSANNYNAALGLGLDLAPPLSTDDLTRAPDTSSGARHPVLALLTHGINDQQGSPADNSPTTFTNTVKAIRAAQYAGCDVLVTIPCFETAVNQVNAALYKAALKNAAEANGAAWVDIGIGGALPGVVPGGTNPHLTIPQYQAQGDFIWDQVLGLT